MKLLTSFLLISTFVSTAAISVELRAVTVMGITLGKPLSLPLCNKSGLSVTCKRGSTKLDYWDIAVSRSLKPNYVRSVRVRVLDGAVAEMQIATVTGSPQSEVMEDLKLKFGKPDNAEMLPDGFRESWNIAGGGAIIHDTESGQISIITPKSWAWKPAKPAPSRPRL